MSESCSCRLLIGCACAVRVLSVVGQHAFSAVLNYLSTLTAMRHPQVYVSGMRYYVLWCATM